MSVGDVFADGRYKALHKLGFVSGILVAQDPLSQRTRLKSSSFPKSSTP